MFQDLLSKFWSLANKNMDILNDMSWSTTDTDKEPTLYYEDPDDQYRQLTEEEWNTVVHPTSDWVIWSSGDERVFDSNDTLNNQVNTTDSHKYYAWQKKISKDATVKDVYNAIKKELSYHYFEGLRRNEDSPMRNLDAGLPKYEACFGT